MWKRAESFLRLRSTEIFVCLALVFEFVLVTIILFFPRSFGSPGGPYRNYVVSDVIDGKTLKVHLLEPENGVHEGGDEVQLVGIWSDTNQEPDVSYRNRVRFFREHLIGKVIQARVHFYVVDLNPPAPPKGPDDNSAFRPETTRGDQMWFETPQRPSEVLLNDGTSLNRFLLANGYASFDLTDRHLEEEDRARYEADEAQSRSARLGIWSSPESAQQYLSAEETFRLRERLKRAGLIFYLLTQALLVVVTVALMYASRRNYGQASFLAVSKLLAIPGVLLLVVFLRLVWTAPAQSDDPNLMMLYGFYLVFVCAALLWGAKQFFTLVALGPLKEWQTLWRSSQAVRAIKVFFLGLAVWTLLFSIVYRFLGGIDSTPASLMVSISQTLNLGYPLPKTVILDKAVLIHNVFIWLWLLLCGSSVPSLKEGPANLSLLNAVFLSLTSVALLGLVTASVFANVYYYNVQFSGFSRPLDLGECFLLAICTFIRKSYGVVYSTSGWMMLAQSLEVLFAFFLQLVGLKFIFSKVKGAVDARG